MDKKKIAIGAVIVIVIAVILNFVLRKDKQTGYVFDKKDNINLKDIKTNFKRVNFDDDNVKQYFSKNVVNPYTIKFFKSIEKRFKDSTNWDEYYDKVKEYLLSVMPEEEAEKLFALFKKYMKYQTSLTDQMKIWGQPKSAEDAVDFLHKLQDYRRKYFGREIADVLWGAEIKAKEYPIRRSAIVNDKNLYGADKEKKLQELNKDMWGDEAGSVEGYAKPYVRYQEKLAIYNKDLSEMSAEDNQAKIREFREEIFTPDVVKRLEEVDQVLADEKKREEDYAAREQEIQNDPNLKPEEKEEKITELQNEIFGGEADAFRRRQNISKGLEELKNKHKK